ncbi:MAG: hypothetical protein QM813_17055 [Verrucomicrobiota bacterium]
MQTHKRPVYEYAVLGAIESPVLCGFDSVAVDPDLLPLDMLRNLLRIAPQEPGIYFLWRWSQLVYIGSTMTDLDARTYFHHAAFRRGRMGEYYPHTHYTCMPRKIRGLRDLEYRYIRAYRPPYNSMHDDPGFDRRVPVTRDDVSYTPRDEHGMP